MIEIGGASRQWIIALEQTAGYGRRGAGWRHGVGDVAASLIFPVEGALSAVGQLSFVAALAAADTILAFAPAAPITLKWPNDILLNGAKAAGLLMEQITPSNKGGSSQKTKWVVWGIGVNIVSKPENLPYPTARLMDWITEAPPSPEAFIGKLDTAFEEHYRVWREQGFAPIRSTWTARAQGIGRQVTVRLTNQEKSGVFAGIDEDGALILKTKLGEERIAAGAVFFEQ